RGPGHVVAGCARRDRRLRRRWYGGRRRGRLLLRDGEQRRRDGCMLVRNGCRRGRSGRSRNRCRRRSRSLRSGRRIRCMPRLVPGTRRSRRRRRAVAIGVFVVDVVRRGGRGAVLSGGARVFAATSAAAAAATLGGTRCIRGSGRRRGSFAAGGDSLIGLGGFELGARRRYGLRGGRTLRLVLWRIRGFVACGFCFLRTRLAGRFRGRGCRGLLRRARLPLRVVAARFVRSGLRTLRLLRALRTSTTRFAVAIPIMAVAVAARTAARTVRTPVR